MNKTEWYKKTWGKIVAFLLLPFFIIWYAWVKANWTQTTKIIATIACSVFILMTMSASAISTPTSPKPTKTETTPAASSSAKVETTSESKSKPVEATPAKPKSVEDQLWSAVDTGLKSRDKLKVTYESTDQLAFLEHTDENPYNADSFVKQTYSLLVYWGQEAFKVPGVNIINVQNKTKFTDSYGNEQVRTGVTIEMSKEQFSKFNWKNLVYLAVHDRIAASSNVYIIVPALLTQIKDPSNKLYLQPNYSK